MKKTINKLSVLFVAVLISTSACGQPASPPATATGAVNGSTITINYSSPAVKGRVIWGDLVPYAEVWRAGANDATTFETSKDIMVEGQSLPAGKYTFFVLPAQNGQWTAIFNKETKQWGAFKYNESQDQLRVKVTPKALSSVQERLVYKVNSNGFSVDWDKLSIPVSIK